MTKIAVVEDHPIHAKQLLNCLTKYQLEHNLTFQINTYDTGTRLLENYSATWNILFLDIEMPFIDGMSLAEKIRELDSSVMIVFVTNLAKYAIKGYSVQAFDYILKPVTYSSFSITMDKLLSVIEHRNENSIILKNKEKIYKLSIPSIYYVEVQKHTLIYHSAEGEFTVRGTLSATEEKLGHDFARCSNCYLVNLAYVDFLSRETVKVGPFELNVSRRVYSDFLHKLSDYFERTVL